MLTTLSIKNFALIKDVEINFEKGLNVMSGETGSGKSVVIEALNFVLGAKADKTLIGKHSDSCNVCVEFDVCDCPFIYSIYDELNFEQDDLLIISRKLTLDGKNTIKVNGNTVNLTMLKKFTSKLVDVHGQSEHFDLLNKDKQLKLVDNFAGNKILDIKNNLSSLIREYNQTQNELDSLGGDESTRLLRIDVLNYQIKEIKESNLQAGEEEELLSIKDKLLNQEKIISALSSIRDILSNESGAIEGISTAKRIAGSISNIGNDYSVIFDRLNSVYVEAEDIAESVSGILGDFDVSEYNLEDVESRLDLIKKLKRKYGSNIEEINNFLSSCETEREKLLNFNELAANLLQKKEKLEKRIYELYVELSIVRKETSKDFAEKVSHELYELGMENGKFCIQFADLPELSVCNFSSSNGIDSITFLFTANVGEELKPLSDVISGGELSRFLLAIKAQSAKFDEISTYIFDEIDTGISGKTANIVAKKLFKISQDRQVIAITHLPQISSFSDNSIYIYKTVDGDDTTTNVKKLSGNEKISEIVRLIDGKSDNDIAIEHAKQLIDEADNYKKQYSIQKKN